MCVILRSLFVFFFVIPLNNNLNTMINIFIWSQSVIFEALVWM